MRNIFYALCILSSALNLGAIEPFSVPRTKKEQGVKTIQVLLEKDATEALVEVKGPYYLFNPHDGSRIASGLLGKRFMARPLESGLKWGEQFPGIHQIYIQPRSEETAIFVNGIQYSGSMAIYASQGEIHIVNDLNIEDYVKSVLASQFPTPLEEEVMSSLAILVRTDAYYRAETNKDSFWHIAASDIRYQGSALNIRNSLIEKAVDKTHHLVLVHSDAGQRLPFPTAWTEHSGGKTAPYPSMFRESAFSPEKGVEAPHAALSREDTKWSYQTSKYALSQALDLSHIRSIETFVERASNKVYALRIQDAEGAKDIDFFTLQKALGKHHILSSDFTLTMKDDRVYFAGYGKGHGVGLCLFSASALAQNGDNALGILAKFFPETYLYNMGQTLEKKKR